VKGFKKCYVSNGLDRNDNDKLWNGSEADGDVRSLRKMEVLSVNLETLTLTGKGK